MFVCICKGVSDKDIEAAIEGGASSFSEVRDQLLVGTQCGKCALHARGIVRDCLSEAASDGIFYDAAPAFS